uniref:Amino acid transporter transmembrane domain-containing protein n=1 Tax=Aegilops tauschii subsp. strangulata TaxID=200361 RepID=A0A453FYV0_AEGTS
LDAGALFVLQSKGSWLHCGYHLTTSIVAPPLLSLPFAFAALGWSAGMVCLVVGAAVTFYSYNLLSRVLEHHAQQGRRQLRFRDMAADILGQYVLLPSYDSSVKPSMPDICTEYVYGSDGWANEMMGVLD